MVPVRHVAAVLRIAYRDQWVTLVTIGSACAPNRNVGHGLEARRVSPTLDENSGPIMGVDDRLLAFLKILSFYSFLGLRVQFNSKQLASFWV